MIDVPPYWQELFGRRISAAELGATLLFCAGMTALLFALTAPEWQRLAGWRTALLVLLAADITGGVIANLTGSTNRYYRTNAKARLLFIAVHIQPVLIAWLFGQGFGVALATWGYAAASALLVSVALATHPARRAIAGALAAGGIAVLLLLPAEMPKLALALLAFYLFKMVYAFAVDHEAASAS